MNAFPLLSDHILVLLFGWLLPFLSGVKSREGFRGIVFTESLRRSFYLSNSLFLFLSAAVIMIHWAWQERAISWMGFRSDLTVKNLPLTLSLTLLLAVLYFGDILFNLIRSSGERDRAREEMIEKMPFLPRYVRELPAYLVMCLAAGICEEIIFRGFLVTYFLPELNQRTGLPYLSVLVPALLFSLAHFYQGWQAILKIFVLSVLLALIFIVGGSIWWVMIIHFLIDLIGGGLSIYLLSDKTGRP